MLASEIPHGIRPSAKRNTMQVGVTAAQSITAKRCQELGDNLLTLR